MILLLLLACTDSTQDLDGDGVSRLWGDCDDTDPSVFPGAEELCDGIDNDCDGTIDGADAEGSQTFWVDADGDGFGGEPVTACSGQIGWATEGGDCDDDDDERYPGQEETCDGVDQDCDGRVDEEPVDVQSGYLDLDQDGWGGELVWTCDPPEGLIERGEDCDDTDPEVNPDADEVCGTAWDDDCDGGANDEDPEGPVDGPVWYMDSDGDGYGDPDAARRVCDAPPEEAVDNGLDCDDGSTEVTIECAVLDVAASPHTVCAVSGSGALRCDGLVPYTTTAWTDVYPNPAGSFVQVSMLQTGQVVCGLRSGGTVECFGPYAQDLTPIPTVAFASIASSSTLYCGVRVADERLECWAGSAWWLELSEWPSSPPAGAVRHLDCGGATCCVVLEPDGAVRCDGSNSEGSELGVGFDQVAVGHSFACGVRDGRLVCLNLFDDQIVSMLDGVDVVAVDMGYQHGVAIDVAGELHGFAPGEQSTFAVPLPAGRDYIDAVMVHRDSQGNVQAAAIDGGGELHCEGGSAWSCPP